MQPTYHIVRFTRTAPGAGVTDPMEAEVSAIVKRNDPKECPYCVPNELIAGELGRQIRLPIPPCGLLVDKAKPTQHWFGSLNFNLLGDSLPPVIAEDCYELIPFLVTGVLLFDIWIANGDRHERNLAMDTSTSTPRLSVFDHSHALFGVVERRGSARLKRLRDRIAIGESTNPSVNRHCFLDVVTSAEHFGEWCDRIASVPDYAIRSIVEEARPGGLTALEFQTAVEFLTYRRTALSKIIRSNRDEFAINDWSDWK